MVVDSLPIIDWDESAKLAGNKPDLAKELVSLLLKQLPTDMENIHLFYKNKNYLALKQLLHKVHGALCYCALPRLKAIVVQLEIDLKNNIINRLPSLLEQLDAEVNLLLKSRPLST